MLTMSTSHHTINVQQTHSLLRDLTTTGKYDISY